MIHPNEPKTIDELLKYQTIALKEGDEKKLYAIEAQIKRHKNVQAQ